MPDSQVDHFYLRGNLVQVAAMGRGQYELYLDLPVDQPAEQVDHHALGTTTLQGGQETGQSHFAVVVVVQLQLLSEERGRFDVLCQVLVIRGIGGRRSSLSTSDGWD